MSAVAAIDLGTISTRLAIVGDGVDDRDAVVTRNEPEALDRCLADYAERLRRHDVDAVRAIATAWARRDPGTLVERASEALGIEVEVVTAEEEASLGFRGAVRGIDHLGQILVVDVGGGSTEFSLGSTTAGLERWFSADIGAASVTTAHLWSDPPAADELSAALSVIELHLDDVRREVRGLADAIGPSGLVVGIGGTISTMAAVELGLPTYDRETLHHFDLDRPAAEDVFRTLATESHADRAHNPGLEPDRVELIVGGSCIVVETMRQFDLDRILVSQDDLLDGIIDELRAS